MFRLGAVVACALLALAGCKKTDTKIDYRCLAGSVACDGTCVRLATDSANCGACGSACGAGEVCSNGACAATCADPLATCGSGAAAACADTLNDPANCGGCGQACPSGQLCSAGACAPSCVAPLATCGTGAGAFCADVAHDPAHCGSCATACGAGEVCDRGTCAATCTGAGGALCGGACVDLATDVANCGACGTACGAGTTCVTGACAPTCPAGQTRCGDRCVDLATDDAACGACGVACPGWAVCAAGSCTAIACRGDVGLPGAPDLVGPRTYGVAAIDVDRDGRLDLVVAPQSWSATAHNDGTIQVLRNLGGRRFAAPVAYPAGTEVAGVCAGDLDGDGVPDVVATGAAGFTVLRGLAAGGFAPPSALVADTALYGVAVADLDGDGRDDVISAGDAITVRLTTSSGAVGPATTYLSTDPVFFMPRSVAVGDVDGDGHPDVVAGEQQGGKLGVFRNDGTGHLLPIVAYDIQNNVQAVGLADVDGDGHLDLVAAADYPRYGLVVLRNAGDGTFGAPTFYDGTFFPGEGMAVADLDGDGHPDVALESWGDLRQVDVYRNAGDGTFLPPEPYYDAGAQEMIAADLDGDGATDLAVASSVGGHVHLLWGAGASFLHAEISPAPLSVQELALADVDGDGAADVVATEWDHSNPSNTQTLPGHLAVLHNAGAGRFTPAQVIEIAGVRDVVAADLDGDGLADVVCDVALQSGGGGVRVYRSEGGTLTLAQEWEGPASALALADLDGDGLLDVAMAVGGYTPGLSWARGRGDGTFDAPVALGDASDAPWRIAVADVDGNGWPDVVGLSLFGDAALWRNLGGGAFVASSLPLPAGGWHDLALGDVTGDGVVDLVLTDDGFDDGKVVVLVGQGDGTFVAGPPLAFFEPAAVRIGAPAGRARNAVLVRTGLGGDLAVFDVAANGALSLAGRWALAGGGGFAVGDVDGDLRPDVVAGGYQRVAVRRATCLP